MGERFDGHDYLDAALAGGAAGCLTAKKPISLLDGKFYIQVPDTLEALKALAAWYRDKFTIPMVQVTGSAGKTTTKEMIASVLGGEGTVSDTQQTPEKTEVFTPTADPNAGTSVEESPDSIIVEEPAESVPAEQPADEQPAEPTPEAPAESEASTEAPAESEASSESTGGAETPSISLPTQEQVEQAAGSLYSAASTVLDALFGSGSGDASSAENDAA